jgi:uncharacterized FAD-dependent dehydrogenase
LEQLVRFGAPEDILTLGKPHLGTDRLVMILKGMRHYLEDKGVEFRFGSRVEDLEISGGRVKGLTYSRVGPDGGRDGAAEELKVDRVVMAAGHTARELYESLARRKEGMQCLESKGFAVGFRIEHPQVGGVLEPLSIYTKRMN